jgi:hypothetical protein
MGDDAVKCNRIFLVLLLAAVLLLTGCAMQTVDMMYCLPRRSDAYDQLQQVIDRHMSGLQYSAPTAGENQQTVQMADLDGDSVAEYLIFARGSAENPMKILIFRSAGATFEHMTTLESQGTSFDHVEYVEMDGNPGVEIVAGRKLSDQVMGAVSVYTFSKGEAEQLMNSGYAKFLCSDLDSDGKSELMILSAAADNSGNGVAVLYNYTGGQLERSAEVNLSEPADCIKRIMVGRIHGGIPAVYVASSFNGSAIVTDIFAVKQGVFTNISFSNESGTSVKTLRNYYVYADDIDDDGILELPSLITMPKQGRGQQYLIRWFAMDVTGNEVDKKYTFHDYAGGWYLELNDSWATRLWVEQEENAWVFRILDETEKEYKEVFRIFAFTGDSRDAAAVEYNRFVLYRTDSVVYAAKLEASSAAWGITEEEIMKAFRLIVMDWQTGET